MNIATFVTIWSTSMSSTDLNDGFRGAPLDFLVANNAVQAVEIYTPEPGDVPQLDDMPAPAIIIQIDLDNAAAAETLVQSDKFQQLFMDKAAYTGAVEKINLEITEPVHFSLPDQETPSPRTAAMSFVVRYYGPVKDASQFADRYTKSHPPILRKFEGIRNVLCYLPLHWSTTGEVLDERLIIGNEVVFDDLDTFNRALKSDVLQEALADGEKFESYGYSTHDAMHRERVYSRRDE